MHDVSLLRLRLRRPSFLFTSRLITTVFHSGSRYQRLYGSQGVHRQVDNGSQVDRYVTISYVDHGQCIRWKVPCGRSYHR